ncbi:MAG: hypothetical protein IMZ64_05030 [Bacteroidetes bacterium]|nr:hypothetical protein [Bacteroidota bacterium]
MSYQPFYISNFEPDSGIQTYNEPFLIPEKAFTDLEDAYCWRGRVKRKLGYDLLARLRRVLTGVALGNSAASPWSFNIYTILAMAGEDTAEIEAGSLSITVGAIVFTDNSDGTLSSITPGNSGYINYQTWAVTLIHTAGAAVATTATFSYYPGLPVMGLPTYETTVINVEELWAFDTKYAYRYTGGAFQQQGAYVWKGLDIHFFWSSNYYRTPAPVNILWVTNFNQATAGGDQIKYWDGATWVTFNPIVHGTDRLQQARCIIPYKGRLLAFNTWEGLTIATAAQFPQRLRWSQSGNPTTLATAWQDDVVGYGGYLDAPSSEQITGVAFIKDTLLVKFERSSWKIVYTGNEQLPFLFEKVNTELGSGSTFSLVKFDKGVFASGNFGITVDSSNNVERIDEKIPSLVFENFNNDFDGPKKIHGIRDFANEMVYWTYQNAETDSVYCDKILAYNYINGTYAIFNDAFTCFGYFQKTGDKTWATTTSKWEATPLRWDGGKGQSRYPDIVAGNMQGYVALLSNENVNNDPILSITNITPNAVNPVIITSPNHGLRDGSIIKITGIIADPAGTIPVMTILNDRIFKIEKIDKDTFYILTHDSGVSFDYEYLGVGSVYYGLGKIQIFNNFALDTKIFSPFYEVGGQARLGYVDFLLDKTPNGEFTNSITIDENDNISISDLYATTEPDGSPGSGLLGNSIVLTKPENLAIIAYQENQAKIWHRFYVQSICQNFQFHMTMTDLQMIDETISMCDFVLHAFVIYISKNARLIQ